MFFGPNTITPRITRNRCCAERLKSGCDAGLATRRCRCIITLMTADAYITCRVSSEAKAQVRALAQREGTNESALVRQLLEHALRAASLKGTPMPELPESASDGIRLNLSFGPHIAGLIRARSRERGMASATYVSSLVRTHLTNGAPLSAAEYLAVKQVVVELSTIRRRLKELVRTMSQGGKSPSPGTAEVRETLRVAEALRDHVKSLVSANTRAWGRVHA